MRIRHTDSNKRTYLKASQIRDNRRKIYKYYSNDSINKNDATPMGLCVVDSSGNILDMSSDFQSISIDTWNDYIFTEFHGQIIIETD